MIYALYVKKPVIAGYNCNLRIFVLYVFNMIYLPTRVYSLKKAQSFRHWGQTDPGMVLHKKALLNLTKKKTESRGQK